MSKRKSTGFDFDMDFSFGDTDADGDGREVAPDPLAHLTPTGDVGADSKAEVSALLEAFKARAKTDDKRKRNATDSEFWFAVCFQSREEKETFLARFGLGEIGDKYLDGEKVAAALASRRD